MQLFWPIVRMGHVNSKDYLLKIGGSPFYGRAISNYGMTALRLIVIELLSWSEFGNRLELDRNSDGNFVRNSFERKSQWIPLLVK